MRRSTLLMASIGLAALTISLRADAARPPPPNTACQVDLKQYLGTWYEIARFPLFFERRCEDVTATYTVREDGKIGVLNRCLRDGEKEVIAKGTARVVDPQTNSKLKVSFFGPFSGDYWILHVDADYRFALVGSPNRKNLWILSRDPNPSPADVQRLEGIARREGFDLNRLERTPQKRAGGQLPPA